MIATNRWLLARPRTCLPLPVNRLGRTAGRGNIRHLLHKDSVAHRPRPESRPITRMCGERLVLVDELVCQDPDPHFRLFFGCRIVFSGSFSGNSLSFSQSKSQP